jgi:TetR/AcrR family transcriptional regulator
MRSSVRCRSDDIEFGMFPKLKNRSRDAHEQTPGYSISSTRRPVRSKGTRDPERTRQNLLDAAYREFAHLGYHAASIARICKRAGVSNQILSHHFGSKEKAYLAVLEAAYVAFRSNDPKLDPEAVDPLAALRDFVTIMFDHVQNNRDFVSLLGSENINKGKIIGKSRVLKAMYEPLIQRLGALIANGESVGVFRPGIDARQLYISLSALCFFNISNAYTLSAVLDTDLTEDAALAERRQHVIDFAMAAVRV